MDEEKLSFTTKIQDIGNSQGIILPKHIVQYLDLKKGDEIGIIDRHGKYGRYISIWKKEAKP